MVLVDQSVELRQRFETAFKNIKAVVSFDVSWRDATGTLGGAVRANLKIGEVARSSCPDSGKRIILVGTAMGVVAVLERYVVNSGSPFKLVYNAPPLLDRLLGGSFLSIAQLSLVVTDFDPKENIGTYLDKMYVTMNKYTNLKQVG